MKLINGIKSFVKDFTLFEKIAIPFFLIAFVVAEILTKEPIASMACGLLLTLCMAFSAKGLIVNFYFGMAYAIVYGIICLQSQLWGSMILSFAYTFPVQIVCMIQWIRNKSNDNKVKVRKFSWKQRILLTAGIATAGGLLAWLLTVIGGNMAFMDSAVTILSIVSMTLMILRYCECWVFNTAAFVFNSTLWLLAIIGGDECVLLLMTSIMSLTFSIYGIINWLKMEKAQRSVLQEQAQETVG